MKKISGVRFFLNAHPLGTHLDPVRYGLLWAATQPAILFLMVKGDALVASGRPDRVAEEMWALTDAPVHGLLAMLVTWPLAARGQSFRKFLLRLSMAGLAAVVIDVDHFVAAWSLSLYAATHLETRPFTHGLLFALACSIFVWRITRNPSIGCLLFLALASHFLRDASTGGIHYLLWPFEFHRMSIPAYHAAQMGLSLAAWIAAQILSSRATKSE